MKATKKSTTNAGKGVTIPAAQFAQLTNIKTIAKELVELDKEREAREAKLKAESEARMDRHRHPLKYLADHDIIEVNRRLGDVVQSLLSIHQIAGEVFDADVQVAALYGVAIREMARANIKGLDACVERLTGSLTFGNFAAELDAVELDDD